MKTKNVKSILSTILVFCLSLTLCSCPDTEETIWDPNSGSNNGTNNNMNEGNDPYFFVINKEDMNPRSTFDDDRLSPTYSKYLFFFDFGFGISKNAYHYGIRELICYIRTKDGAQLGSNPKEKNVYYELHVKAIEGKESQHFSFYGGFSSTNKASFTFTFEYLDSDGVRHSLQSLNDELTIEAALFDENNNDENNGNNSGNNNNNDNNNDSNEYLGGLNVGSTVTSSPGPQPLTYKINGTQFNMILVDGGSTMPFYIMQTELPPSAIIEINSYTFGPCDANGDNVLTTNEYKSFIQDIRKRTGWNLRMPTIAEWVFAAKGGKLSKGYTYCGSNSLNDVAWYSSNARKAQSVAQKVPNELSLYDMSGNYGELTYYENPDSGNESVDGDIYGGCWNSSSNQCYPTSWVENLKNTGFVNKYTHIRHTNACDASKETFRLVYQKP